MRWYTRDWQRGDEPAVDPGVAYADYVRSVEPQLPVHVREFALPKRRHLAIDDARVDLAEFNRKTGTLRLRLLNGDLPTGYGTLTLEFDDADVVDPPLREAGQLLADRSTEFLVHEVERLARGHYEVRFLLYPRGELHVQCTDVRASWEPVVDRTRTDYRSDVRGFSGTPVT